MEITEQRFLALIRSEFGGECDPALFEGITKKEQEEIYTLASRHDLSQLVADAAKKTGLMEADEDSIFTAFFRTQNLEFEAEAIKNLFNAEKIPFIPLKGLVLRKLYPEEWMRTSCDIDILVRREDLDRAREALTTKLSYTFETAGKHEILYLTESGFHMELHFALIEEKVFEKADGLLASVWESASPVAEYEYAMSEALFDFFNLHHMAKHFLRGGCGVRAVLDLWLLEKARSGERAEYRALLREGELAGFAAGAEKLARVFFDGEEEDELSAAMGAYVFGGGVYGNRVSCKAVQQVQMGSKLAFLISRLWLRYPDMLIYYPEIGSRKWLLPYYNAKRLASLLFGEGRETVKKEMRAVKAVPDQMVKDMKKLMGDLGLE